MLEDSELEEIQRMAHERRMSTTDWVRQTLQEARRRGHSKSPEEKLKALRLAASHSFPTADIEQMLDEIEQGYGAQPPE